jgi:trimeric autotransporter adhesin
VPVFVDGTGRLGSGISSARYKHDIHDMGEASDKLMKLRPVSFRYNSDPSNIQQYGLIAEEVAKVYPELVINDADGKPQTVAYHLLPAMLLNEVQKKDKQIVALQKEVGALKQKVTQIDAMATRLDALEREARVSRPERRAAHDALTIRRVITFLITVQAT